MFINHLPEYKDNYIQYENFIAIHRDNNNIIDIYKLESTYEMENFIQWLVALSHPPDLIVSEFTMIPSAEGHEFTFYDSTTEAYFKFSFTPILH